MPRLLTLNNGSKTGSSIQHIKISNAISLTIIISTLALNTVLPIGEFHEKTFRLTYTNRCKVQTIIGNRPILGYWLKGCVLFIPCVSDDGSHQPRQLVDVSHPYQTNKALVQFIIQPYTDTYHNIPCNTISVISNALTIQCRPSFFHKNKHQ